MVAFGGDDVSALVVEFGSQWIKIGYAGDDIPVMVIPSFLGITGDTSQTQNSYSVSISDKTFYVGDMGISYPRPNMDIVPLNSDPTHIQALFTHVFQYLHVDSKETPILVSENPGSDPEFRSNLVKILFHTFQVPAIYVARSSVLAAFSQGKSLCLVVDVGASHVRISPIIDGYLLQSGYIQQPLAGTALTKQARFILENDLNIPVITHYEVESKRHVDLKKPADFVQKPFPNNVTTSFKEYCRSKVVQDFKESVVQVSETKLDLVETSLHPTKYYEFPNGYNRGFLAERYRIAETLFNPKEYLIPDDFTPEQIESLLGIPQLIQESISRVDMDVRTNLFNNILVFGGTSLIPGFYDRLSKEINTTMGAQKNKIYMGNTTYEKIYAPWIGGSILGSMGTFQQMWVSRSEYDEHGSGVIDTRCQL